MCRYTPIKNIYIANHKIIKMAFALNVSDKKEKKERTEYTANLNQKYAERVTQNKKIAFTVNGYDVFRPKPGGKKGEIVKHRVTYPCKLRVVEDPLLNLSDAERENLKTPPNLFDRLIFTALTSAYHEGIKEISVAALYRIITGKNNFNCKPSENHVTEILASVKKLACLQVSIDATDAFTSYTHKDGTPKYNDGKPLVIDFTPIIPCTIFSGIFQSDKNTEVIRLTAESPLFKVARLMNQLLTVPRTVLDVGKTRHTANIYKVKFCTLFRVVEIPKARNLTDVITFDDLFTKCGIDNASPKIKATARDIIAVILRNLQSADVLKAFKIIRDGAEYAKIELTYLSKSEKSPKKAQSTKKSNGSKAESVFLDFDFFIRPLRNRTNILAK